MASVEELQSMLGRLAVGENRIAAMETQVTSLLVQFASSEERSMKLVADLQSAFTRIEEEVRQIRERGGRGGGRDQALVDTRMLGKPALFHGKASEWRD